MNVFLLLLPHSCHKRKHDLVENWREVEDPPYGGIHNAVMNYHSYMQKENNKNLMPLHTYPKVLLLLCMYVIKVYSWSSATLIIWTSWDHVKVLSYNWGFRQLRLLINEYARTKTDCLDINQSSNNWGWNALGKWFLHEELQLRLILVCKIHILDQRSSNYIYFACTTAKIYIMK